VFDLGWPQPLDRGQGVCVRRAAGGDRFEHAVVGDYIRWNLVSCRALASPGDQVVKEGGCLGVERRASATLRSAGSRRVVRQCGKFGFTRPRATLGQADDLELVIEIAIEMARRHEAIDQRLDLSLLEVGEGAKLA